MCWMFSSARIAGTKLEFSDLLMSIAVAHWQGDFRRELDELTKTFIRIMKWGFILKETGS